MDATGKGTNRRAITGLGLGALLVVVVVLVFVARRPVHETAPTAEPPAPAVDAPAPAADAPPPAAAPEAPPAPEVTERKPPKRVDIVDEPVLVSQAPPIYPDIAKKMRIQGKVQVKAMIAKDGRVESARVLRGVHPALDDAAVRAVTKWRYRPARVRGQAVPTSLKVTVEFKL